MKKKNLLVISYSYLPRLSGVASVINNYLQQLNQSQTYGKITVLCFRDNPQLAEHEVIEGIRIVRFNSPSLFNGRIPFVGRDFFVKLNHILKDPELDCVHVHTRFSISSLFGAVLSRNAGKKVIHFEHLSDYISGESFVINTASYLWDQTVSKLIFAASNKIVCVSESVQKFLIKQLLVNKAKTVVIENGSDVEPSPINYADKFIGKKKFELFYAARFVPLKNPLLTLQAVKILAQTRDDFHLTIAGDGRLKNQIIQFIKDNDLDSRVTYVGKLTRAQMHEQYQKSDIFLNPSMLEGFCGTVLEAVFNTNICIVSDVGGNKDIVTAPECLMPVKKMSPEYFAKKISHVLNNLDIIHPQFQEIKDFAVQNYTWENAKTKLLQIDNLVQDQPPEIPIYKELTFMSLLEKFFLNPIALLMNFCVVVSLALFLYSQNFPVLVTAIAVSLLVLVLPFVVGSLSSRLLLNTRFFDKVTDLPLQFTYWAAWLIGIVCLNLPYLFTSIVKANPFYAVLIFAYLLYTLTFVFKHREFEPVRIESIGRPLTLDPYYLFSFAGVMIFYLVLYSRYEWTTLNPDILQNYHLGVLFNQNRFEITGDRLTPMFNVVSYTNALIPLYAFISNLFDFKNILNVFSGIEIGLLIASFFTRIYFFKYLTKNNLSAALLTLVSFLIISSGMQPVNLLINQQIVSLVFLPLLYLYLEKKYRVFAALLALGFLFHTIASALVLILVISDLVFRALKEVKGAEIASKILYAALLAAGTASILISSNENINLTAYGWYSAITKSNTILDSVIGFKQLPLFERLVENLGFINIGFMASALLIPFFIDWIKYRDGRDYTFIFFNLALSISLVFTVIPLSFRFAVFFTILMLIAIYITLKAVFQSNKVVNIFLCLALLSTLLMIPIKENKADSAAYYKEPYFRNTDVATILNYRENSQYSDLLKQGNVGEVKIMSDYFTKHLTEISYNKFNDVGSYENKDDGKGEMRNFLMMNSTNPCETYGKDYLLVIFNNRTNRWLSLPYFVTNSTAFNVWQIGYPDSKDVRDIQNFEVSYEKATLIETKQINNYKFNLFQCLK